MRGLEPPFSEKNTLLKRTRLPVSPHRHEFKVLTKNTKNQFYHGPPQTKREDEVKQKVFLFGVKVLKVAEQLLQ